MKINDDMALLMIDKIIKYFEMNRDNIERLRRCKDHPERVLKPGYYLEIEKVYSFIGDPMQLKE
jgi:hypothetical protein